MYKYLGLLSLFFPVLCFSLEFDEAFQIADEQFKSKLSGREAYLLERMEYENSIGLDERGNCYAHPGGGVTLVIRINETGVLDLVLSNIENTKSECFKKLYLGTKYKAPPIAPIYQIMKMGYNIAPPKKP
tara:strand:- start:3232 stop:3621 length:390 start_codon:yes stop_codon:yes gene_type:complete